MDAGCDSDSANGSKSPYAEAWIWESGFPLSRKRGGLCRAGEAMRNKQVVRQGGKEEKQCPSSDDAGWTRLCAWTRRAVVCYRNILKIGGGSASLRDYNWVGRLYK